MLIQIDQFLQYVKMLFIIITSGSTSPYQTQNFCVIQWGKTKSSNTKIGWFCFHSANDMVQV